jgi:protein-disulfide isomerase
MKQIIVIIVAVVGIVGAAVLLGGGDEEAAGAPSNNFFGQESAEVVVTEYADFECPACAQFTPIVDQVKEQFADQVRFEFRHFPLVSIHPNAIAAHRAAEAAGQQGKFWEMHSVLFERQNAWRAQSSGAGGFTNTNAAETFRGYAVELGLDMEQYDADVPSSETIGTINADIALGRENGVESTPTFFINGEQIIDSSQVASVEGFSALIEEALAGATDGDQSSETGTDQEDSTQSEEATRPDDEPVEE